MSEVLAIGFLKHELLKAAARKRKQPLKLVQPGSPEGRSEKELPRQGQEKHSR